ncbi:MAG: tetratricopeptide repeat protein [Chitinophagales bacterium]|nr:tetratricopeptide repeat protein [Chitinophagales bacterium]
MSFEKRILYKKTSCFWILLLLNFRLFSQATSLYTDPDIAYKKGLELFQQQKYGAAQSKFRESIYEINSGNEPADHLLMINARYYDAYSSKMLKRPDAELLFTSLTEDFEENPTTRLAYFQLGDIYFNQKKYDKALPWYKKVDPNDLSAEERNTFNFQFGYSYFFKKQFKNAKPYFALIKDVNNQYYYPANYYYGYITYREGNFADALKSFKLVEGSQLYGNFVQYYIANIDFLQGKYDEVINYISSLKPDENLPYYLEMQQLIGKAYFRKGEYDKALPYFNAYFSGTQKLEKADIYEIGFCQYKTKDYTDAINSFKQLNVLNDSLGQNALYLLGDCYLKTNQKSDARLAFGDASKMKFDPFVKQNSFFQYAKLSSELNYHDAALKSLQDFIAQYPKSDFVEEAKEHLSIELLNTSNYRDALGVIRSVSNKTPSIREAYQKIAFSRGTELFNQGDYDGAISLFDESLKNPADAGIQGASYFWKGESFYNLKKYDDAVKHHLQFLEVAKLKSSLPENVSLINADYTLGYSFLKLQQYGDAITYFNKVSTALAASKNDDNKMVADALLRAADCNFVLRNYSAAKSGYQKVMDLKYPGTDYALYQRAIIFGVEGNATDKIAALKQITSGYSSSIYLDDALYELGTTYLSVPSYQNAASVYSQIITSYPSSSYARKAHVKMGLIYFNLNDNTKSLDEYKWVVSHAPNSPESAEALNGIKEVFIDEGNATGYVEFLKNIPNAKVSNASQDSVSYLAAETKFSKGDCNGSVKEFSDYLKSFPNGAFALSAHFYRGECLYQQNQMDQAISDYEFVADQPQGRFSEKALLKAARMNYNNKKDYTKSYNYYKILSGQADYKSDALEAYKGMMYSAYFLNNYSDAENAANLILQINNASTADELEAHYYLGKTALAREDLNTAYNEFLKSSKIKSVIGAESSYQIALIYFKQNNYKQANEQCYTVIKKSPSSDYWIAKSYLLIADIFEVQNDYFQAKSTLQSIIDNYKGSDDIIPTAKDHLDKVLQKESGQSKLKSDDASNETDADSLSKIVRKK